MERTRWEYSANLGAVQRRSTGTLNNRFAMARYQKRSWLIFALGTIAGLVGLFFAYLFLGMATGVVAMCGWAPRWWYNVYFVLAFAIPAAAVWLGSASRRAYLGKRRTQRATVV